MTTVSLNNRPGGFATGSTTPTIGARAKRIVDYRRILKLLVSRDLKVRYAGSALGYVWTVLDPLLMSLVYFFVFTKIFNRNAGKDFDPYMVYLVSGQLAWSWFTGGVSGVTRALRAEAQMVRSSNVPRELWVLRVVMSRGVEYLLSLPVLAIFALAYATRPTKYIILLPAAWVLEFMLIVGFGLILAPAAVLFKDLERIVPIVLRLFFYGSPILYSVTSVPNTIQNVFSLNPAVGFLTLSHAAFFPAALREKVREHVGGTVVVDKVSTSIVKGQAHVVTKSHIEGGRVVVRHITHWDWVWHSALATAVIFAIGVIVFVRLERSVLKEI